MSRHGVSGILALVVLLLGNGNSEGADLFGIDEDSGNLYRVSTTDASLQLVGNTGIRTFGDIQFSPDGQLYGITTGQDAGLYRINPLTAQTSLIGYFHSFAFEGALAFAPDGTAYGANLGTSVSDTLCRIDLTTGQATVIGVIGDGNHDINGLGWRSDGELVALDRVSNSLLTIDVNTAASSVLTHLTPEVGAAGGMSVAGDRGYFCTGNVHVGASGSDELYAFDALTGAYSLVGHFPAAISGDGISGLALMVPEPSVGAVAVLGMMAWGFLGKRSYGKKMGAKRFHI